MAKQTTELAGTRSEIVNVYGKFPPTFKKKWAKVFARPMVGNSSNFPWNMESLMAEEGHEISIKLINYTWGADSQRWYKVTVL